MNPVLTRDQARELLTRATGERDAIQANLLDLNDNFGRKILSGATLTGTSARQWEATSAALTTLWDNFAAYSAVIDRAQIILYPPGRLAPARLEEASELLTGLSVKLVRPILPLGQRDLTAGSELKLTLLATVQAMKRLFTEVAAVLTAVERVWNEITDQLRPVSDRIARARQLAAVVADRELASALALAETTLRELRTSLSADPLSLWTGGGVDTSWVDRLKRQEAAVTSRVNDLSGLTTDADQRIAEVSDAVAAARQAWQDAMAARQRAAALVLVMHNEALPDVSGLAGRQRALADLRAAGRWTRLESELDLLGRQSATVLAQCRQAEQAAAGLVGQRDELRGLLGAYRAKAAGLGAIENTDLDDRFRLARDLLWSAPCDLAAATDAVAGYQRAILALGQGAGGRGSGGHGSGGHGAGGQGAGGGGRR